jgi:imidazolonepropionase-like amidohydrolase
VDVFVKDVSIFDPRSGTLLPHRDIVVIDTKIASVVPTGNTSPNAKVVINGSGKFAIPGLFDNHIHIARLEKETAAILLAFGVTSVRDMGSDVAKIQDWRKGLARGKYYGPRILQACGPMLEGKGEHRIDHWVVADPAGALEAVARISAAGMNCVKVRTYKDEETYLAIAAAAKANGLMLVGHPPEPLTPEFALKAGQKSFEHAFYPYPLSKLTNDQRLSVLDAFRSARAAVVPTLIAWKPATQSATELEQKLANHEKGHDFDLPHKLLEHWRKAVETHKQQKRGSQGWRDAFATASSDVGEMYRAGIIVLPGTDTGAPFVVPGLSLHEELRLLVHAVGMTPAEALRSATIESAAFYGRESEFGSIESGKFADFVILNRSPLDQIENTVAIDAVVFRGEALTRAHLNIFLSRTKASQSDRQ